MYYFKLICFYVLVDRHFSNCQAKIHQIPLNNEGSSKLYWTVDYVNSELQFEVHVSNLSKTDWFAVGFSDYGKLTSADYCVFWRDWKLQPNFQDTWTDEIGHLTTDEQQNCRHFRYKTFQENLKLTFTRKFDTCDQRDYIIEDGTTHIVWAIGRGPLFSIDGVNIKSSKENGYQRTQLLKNIKSGGTHPSDTVKLDILADHVKVPSEETTYWCHIFKLPQELTRKHHVIQYEAVIEKGHEHVVHHMEVFHCESASQTRVTKYSGSCFDRGRPDDTHVCKRVLAAWAMGATPFVYPEEAGLPIGGPDFNLNVMLEVHFNNPGLIPGIVDSSGIRFYVTPSLRKYDGGVIELGLEYTDKMAIPPLQPNFELSGFCVAECTAVGVPTDGLVIFGSQLHTHLTGVKVYTRHIRDGRELNELNRDNHYSTHFQEIRLLKNPVQVLPGDALITTCVYNTEDRENITLGGFSISDEMCINYIHYYPKTELEVCKSSLSYEALFTYFRYLHEWENQQTNSNRGISDNYKSIEWSPIRTQVLHDLYTTAPLSMQCNQSNGERFPGYWENIPLTQVLYPLPPKPRQCMLET